MQLWKHPHALVTFVIGMVLQILQTSCDIVINEVKPINTGSDNQEFIELYNPGTLPVLLDEYTVVLYEGNGNRAYAIISLQHGMIAPHSYYVIGSSNVNPQPDRLIDEKSNVNILPNGPNAVALYHGNSAMFVYNMQVTNISITDALVYDNEGQHNDELSRILTPDELTVQRPGQQPGFEQKSMSRCNGVDPLKLSQWVVTSPTPGRTNNCTQVVFPNLPPPDHVPSFGDLPSITNLPPFAGDNPSPFVIINEFDIGAQYVELYDGGSGDVGLDGLLLVFYSGATSTVYANPINLNGYRTDINGYFLVAPNNFSPSPDIALSSAITNNGVNAIAIHFGLANVLGYGSPITSMSLVDVVVYGDIPHPEDNYLVTELSQGHLPLIEDDDGTSNQVRSLSRCRGWHKLMPQSFRTTDPSPKADNVCELPLIVLNEINVAAEVDSLDEFIELYDGGVGHQSLDGLVVALYNGKTSMLYKAYDLTGSTTDARGFAVIGFANHTYVDVPIPMDPGRGFLQPGLDAVALHLDALPRFNLRSPVSRHNLVDAIVYGTNDDPDLAFLHSLLPFQDIPNELTGYGTVDHSISRCVCCVPIDSSSFGVGPISPGEINMNCVRNNQTVTETLDHYQNIVRINEIHMTVSSSAQGEYIELYDSGLGGIPLDNFAVVVYNGNGDDRASRIVSLNGYQTDSQGFFVIGTSAVSPTPQLTVNGITFFPSGSGAVAIHKVPTEDMMTFSAQTPATRSGLIDVVVYGSSQDFDLQLVETLVPDQSQMNIDALTDGNSILRCFSHEASNQLAFTIGQSSPGSDNTCPLPSLVINEVNVVGMGQDIGEFVELSSKGVANFPLGNLHLVFWRGQAAISYKVIQIDGYRTDANGFFLIGYEGLVSPKPDMTPFPRPLNYIKDASNVISLHVGPRGTFYKKMPLTSEGLIDAIAHRNPNPSARDYAPSVLETLTPGVDAGVEPFSSSLSNRDESINRCEAPSGAVSLQAAHISPKAHNHCPTREDAELIINEVNLVSSEQYIELWDKGAGFTNLDNFVIILYGEDNLSYWTIPLTDFITDAMGYFVMGVSNTVPHAQFIFAEGFLRTQYGAIALYRPTQGRTFPESGPATIDDLIDAVVYSDDGDRHNDLSSVLTPTSTPVQSSLLQISTISLSRCFSANLRTSSAFSVMSSTPKTMNDCPTFTNDIFINEINVEQPGDRSKEFIELSDGGRGNTSLKYLSLVLFNGHYDDKSYSTFDLDGYTTNKKGFLLIASDRVRSGGADIAITVNQAGLLQNGPDAIALYRAPVGAFPYGTLATTKSLIDAIVYNTGDGLSHSLLDKLLPGRSMVLEDPSHLSADESISRCLGNHRLDPLVYSLSRPTPGRRNDCSAVAVSPDSLPTFYISEISVDIPGKDFIELTNEGATNSVLNGLILVFFNGANQDRSYLEIDLSGARMNRNHLLVIGNRNVSPQPDIIIPDNIHRGPDAVVLYYAKVLDFPRGTIVTNTSSIVDALVYGNSGGDSSLLQSLAPGQVMAEVTPGMTLSRCMLGQAVTMSAFSPSSPTPGLSNDCSQAPIIINEVDLGQSRPTGLRGQYIELFDGGRGQARLTDYILVLFTESDGKAYRVVSLSPYSTNSDGYFIIGNPNSAATLQVHLALPLGFIKEGAGAIVLYKSSDTSSFNTDMVPTQANLVDVVVYGTKSSVAMTLMGDLLPGQQQVNIDEGLLFCCEWTISRCQCCQTRQISTFGIGPPTPLRTNNCSISRPNLAPPSFIINEINPRNRNFDTEYIELKGPIDTPLDNYILVLFSERGRSSYTVNLSQKRTDHNGLALIGSHGMIPSPTVMFASSNVPIIHQGLGAVVLYRGVVTDFPVGTQMTSENLVDAVVYSNDQTKLDNELTAMLTPGSSSFYAGNIGFKEEDGSISRCKCCEAQTNSVYTLSTPTPYQPNLCPSEKYSTTIQMHLLNAIYDIWMENLDLVVKLKIEMAAGINQYCQCGFNVNYLTDDKILNGSVVFQSTMLALNANQSELLISSYKQYIQNTNKVKVHGTIYIVDSQCVSNCIGGGLPAKRTGGKKGLSPVKEEAIAVLCIIFLSTLLVCLYLLIRYRKQIWVRVKRSNTASGDGEFPVVFRRHSQRDQDQGSQNENDKPTGSFANPVYMYEGASGSNTPTVVVTKPSSKQPKDETESRTSGIVSKLKSKGMGARRKENKGSFENPLYGLGSSPVQTEFKPSERQENGAAGGENVSGQVNAENKKKVGKDGSLQSKLDKVEEEDGGMKKSSKKAKKPKRPDSFANPLYGTNAGPAQLDVTVTHHENGAVAAAGGSQSQPGTITLTIGNQGSEVQNSAVNQETNRDVQSERKETGIKEKILKKLRLGQDERNGTDNGAVEQAPSRFMHM